VRGVRVWARVLGVEDAVVEDVRLEAHKGEDVLVVAVRPGWRSRRRCGICQRRCPGLDAGGGRRRWRALDLATIRTY